jgi:hypothetical protein
MSKFEQHATYDALKRLTVFNSTSIAAGMICKHIRQINRMRSLLREYKNELITLEQYNQHRKWMGFPPVSATVVRHLRMPKPYTPSSLKATVPRKPRYPNVYPYTGDQTIPGIPVSPVCSLRSRASKIPVNPYDDARRYAN